MSTYHYYSKWEAKHKNAGNYQDTTYPSTVKQTLAQEGKMNVEIKKRIMSKKKTTLPSLRDQERKTVKAQRRICSGEWNAQTLLGFWDTNGSRDLSLTTRRSNN